MKGINVIFDINIFIIITIFLSFFFFHYNFFFIVFAIHVCIDMSYPMLFLCMLCLSDINNVMSYTMLFLCMLCLSDINNVMLILSLICIMFTVLISIYILNLYSNYFIIKGEYASWRKSSST